MYTFIEYIVCNAIEQYKHKRKCIFSFLARCNTTLEFILEILIRLWTLSIRNFGWGDLLKITYSFCDHCLNVLSVVVFIILVSCNPTIKMVMFIFLRSRSCVFLYIFILINQLVFYYSFCVTQICRIAEAKYIVDEIFTTLEISLLIFDWSIVCFTFFQYFLSTGE